MWTMVKPYRVEATWLLLLIVLMLLTPKKTSAGILLGRYIPDANLCDMTEPFDCWVEER